MYEYTSLKSTIEPTNFQLHDHARRAASYFMPVEPAACTVPRQRHTIRRFLRARIEFRADILMDIFHLMCRSARHGTMAETHEERH